MTHEEAIIVAVPKLNGSLKDLTRVDETVLFAAGELDRLHESVVDASRRLAHKFDKFAAEANPAARFFMTPSESSLVADITKDANTYNAKFESFMSLVTCVYGAEVTKKYGVALTSSSEAK